VRSEVDQAPGGAGQGAAVAAGGAAETAHRSADAFSVLAAARDAADAPGLRVGERVLAFAELAALTRERLRELGDPPADGAPLPVTGSNTLETAVTLYALLEQRRAALLLHPRLTAPEREALLAAARAAGRLPSPDAAAVMFTSGTTGTPRAAVLTRGALLASARASEANLRWQPDDCWLMAMPIAHVGGLSILTRCLAARRCVALAQGFDAAALPAQLERDRITLVSLVPTMLARLLDAHPQWRGAPSLRAILLGGAAASPKLLARAAQRGLPLLASYGLTESCAQVCATRYDERFSALQGDAGEPLPGARIRVVDGRIQVAGPTMMAGYWGEPPLAPGAWFDTGDLGEIDASGRLWVHARRTDLIVTGGENVYPGEVERTLEGCPGVAAAGVFGIADEVWGQTVAAALVAEGEAPSDAALLDYVTARLAPHKRPRSVCWVPSLPLTPGNKLDRQALGALAGACGRLAACPSTPATTPTPSRST
jgi:O-succinylbenzoic acid--CoA ligase